MQSRRVLLKEETAIKTDAVDSPADFNPKEVPMMGGG
jgi:hypothetical protein